jgi:hypothetical protein
VKAVEDVVRRGFEALMEEHVSRVMRAIRTSLRNYMGLLRGEVQKFVEKVSAMESDLERTKREREDEILRAVEDAVRKGRPLKDMYQDWKGRSGVTEGRVAGVLREGLGNGVEPQGERVR